MIDDKIKEKISKRQEANISILEEISKMVHEHPELRFCQILMALDVVRQNEDPFYVESVDTLKRIKDKLDDYKSK